jgi:hypothetical protein
MSNLGFQPLVGQKDATTPQSAILRGEQLHWKNATMWLLWRPDFQVKAGAFS